MNTPNRLLTIAAIVGFSAFAADKPNVVLILADDMGYGDVGYHGTRKMMTPNIDKLAAGGIHFTQGYVSASVCHHNLIFLDPYYDTFYDSRERQMPPTEFQELITETDYICIPHQLADGGSNIPKDWRFTDERGQCVAEIYQNRGSFEYDGCPQMANEGTIAGRFIQDAWAQGVIIGVIASPDHWGANGKAGIWAEELTRKSLLEALHARHTFGTTDAKLAIRLSTPDAIMGDKVKTAGEAIPFTIAAEADREIKEMVLFRNNEVVCTCAPNDCTFEHVWTDSEPLQCPLAWYYARIETADGELAWTSPIWFES